MTKKFISLLTFLMACSILPVSAQMSEDRIIQYVAEQQEKGVSQEQIIMDLSKRGVSLQQLQKMREKYEKSNATGILGNTLSDGTARSADRTRNSLVTTDELNASGRTMNLRNSQAENERNARLNQQEQLQMMYDESMFLFTDSVYLLMESLKPKKEIFGHNLFQNDNLTFETGMNIATPKNYRFDPVTK